MADQKLTALSDLPSPLPTDDLYVVSDPGGTPVSKRATIQHVVQAVSGGLYLLESHTASSSATLDFTTFISSTYDTYLFVLVNILPATSTDDLRVRIGTGVGPSWDTGNNYAWALTQSSQIPNTAQLGATTVSFMKIAHSLGNGGTLGVCGNYYLYNPQSTASVKYIQGNEVSIDSGANFINGTSSGLWSSTTAATGVRFLMSSGNIASGTIRAYGVGK